jgi:hypothetical protein
MTNTAILYQSLRFEHREVARKFYEYVGPQPEGKFLDHLKAESPAPGFIVILDDDGAPIKSLPY